MTDGSLNVFLVGVALSGKAVLLWSLQLCCAAITWSRVDVAAGISGAAGRKSTICVAATNVRAGAGGVTGVKLEGTDAAISGTVGTALAADTAIGCRKGALAVGCPEGGSTTALFTATEETGRLLLIEAIRVERSALPRWNTCCLSNPSHSPMEGVEVLRGAGGGGGGGGFGWEEVVAAPDVCDSE